MQKKALIFDYFGVLYPVTRMNFFERHKNLFNEDPTYLEKLNLEIDLGRITRAEFFKGLEKKTGMLASKIQTEIDNGLIFDEELIEFIKKLKKSYIIGLLSNAGKEEIDIIYRDKINDLFDVMTVSYEVGVVKPDLKIYFTCVKRLGVLPEECIFIDDSPVNTTAGERAGISSILFKNTKQLKSELLKYNIS